MLLFNGFCITLLAFLTIWGVTTETQAKWHELDGVLSYVGMHINPEIADAFGLKILALGAVVAVAGHRARARRQEVARATGRAMRQLGTADSAPSQPVAVVGRLAAVGRPARRRSSPAARSATRHRRVGPVGRVLHDGHLGDDRRLPRSPPAVARRPALHDDRADGRRGDRPLHVLVLHGAPGRRRPPGALDPPAA